jgi:hypothetical protein
VGRDDEDRRRDGGDQLGPDPFSLDDLVIPDDARELDADLLALQREQRAAERAARLRGLLLPRHLRQHGLTGPIVVLTLTVVAALASLMLTFQPRRPATKPVPMATSGVRDVGEAGGLLPALTVRRADGEPLPLRAQRPAAVTLVPEPCDCADRLRTIGLAASRQRVSYLLVGRALPEHPDGLSRTAAVRAAEPSGLLLRTYQVGRAPVLLLVRGDGVVNRIVDESTSQRELESELAALAASGAVDGG